MPKLGVTRRSSTIPGKAFTNWAYGSSPKYPELSMNSFRASHTWRSFKSTVRAVARNRYAIVRAVAGGAFAVGPQPVSSSLVLHQVLQPVWRVGENVS